MEVSDLITIGVFLLSLGVAAFGYIWKTLVDRRFDEMQQALTTLKNASVVSNDALEKEIRELERKLLAHQLDTAQNYAHKSHLASIESKLDRIWDKLDSKADRS